MTENSCFRRPLESQRVHGCQTPLKSARQHLRPNIPLSQDKLSSKTSFLVRSEALEVFGNTVTADHVYPCHN